MSYIGQQPLIGAFSKLDDISSSFNGTQTTFALSVGGTPVFGGGASAFLISLDGVLQEANVSYNIVGTNIVFTTAPTAGTSFFGTQLGHVLTYGSVSDGAITAAKLAAGDAQNIRVVIGTETGASGTLRVPAGSTAQRSNTIGVRYNTTLSRFEGFNGTAWGSIGGGATGGGADQIFFENDAVMTQSHTINRNSHAVGPITISDGATLTIADGVRVVIL